MKDTKFRAWDKIEKKWIDDTDIAINQAGLLFIRYEGQIDFRPISLTKSANYEIVFYTGLKDKNGKEIYSGDLVRFEDMTGEVYWWDEKGAWHIEAESKDGGEGSPPIWQYELEIIGNIYKTPELLNNLKEK